VTGPERPQVVTGIHIALATKLPMRAVDRVTAEARSGLVGDRYHGTRHRHVSVQSASELAESAERHRKTGDSVYLLQPQLKEGPGGLRDLHTALWMAKMKFKVRDFRALVTVGVVTEKDIAELEAAIDFLWRVRNAIKWTAVMPFIGGSAVGVAIGTLLLTTIDQNSVRLTIGVLLIVISFDRDDRDPGILQKVQTRDRVVHRLGRNAFFVKEVAAHDDEIDFFTDRILMKNIDPRVEEVARTFGQLISCAAQMHVGDVQKLHDESLSLSDFPS